MSDKQGKQGLAISCKYHPDAPLSEEYPAGDLVCTECGVVAAERVIDVGSEWRTFSDDSSSKNNYRVGQAENYLYNNDLGTVVESEKAEVAAENVDREIEIDTDDLNNSLMDDMECYMTPICSRLELEDILKIATHVMKQATEIHELQSRSPVSLIAASVYLTALATNKDITISKISEATPAAESTIRIVYKMMRQHAASLFPEHFKFVIPVACFPA